MAGGGSDALAARRGGHGEAGRGDPVLTPDVWRRRVTGSPPHLAVPGTQAFAVL